MSTTYLAYAARYTEDTVMFKGTTNEHVVECKGQFVTPGSGSGGTPAIHLARMWRTEKVARQRLGRSALSGTVQIVPIQITVPDME